MAEQDQKSADITAVLTMLGRIDERTQIQAREAIETREAIRNLSKIFATKEEVQPMKRLYYGLIGVVFAGLVGGAIALLFQAAQP